MLRTSLSTPGVLIGPGMLVEKTTDVSIGEGWYIGLTTPTVIGCGVPIWSWTMRTTLACRARNWVHCQSVGCLLLAMTVAAKSSRCQGQELLWKKKDGWRTYDIVDGLNYHGMLGKRIYYDFLELSVLNGSLSIS